MLSHLGLGNDLDGDVLSLELALLGLGGAGVAEVAAPNLPAELVLGREMLGVSEGLVQPQVRFGALGDGRFIGLDQAMPARQERADVLGGRRRRERERALARRRGGDAGVGR